MRVTRKRERWGELPIKRFYAPFKLTTACPGCGKKVEEDMGDTISYPTPGVPYLVPFYHECDGETSEEWEEAIIIDITVRAAE